MNVEELTAKLEAAQKMAGLSRKEAYNEALDDAKRLFPDFARAVACHLNAVSKGERLSPYKTPTADVFRRVFESVPGLSRAYGFVLKSEFKGFKPAEPNGYWDSDGGQPYWVSFRDKYFRGVL